MNKLILLGRVGKGIEVTGKVGILPVAVKRERKNEDGTYTSDWFRIKVFGDTITTIKKYVQIGDTLLFECKVQQNNWQDKDGLMHYDWDFLLERFEFVSKAQQPATPKQEPKQNVKPAPPETVEEITDEDLPF